MARKSPLFSTYRQGENRVTASILAVFERIDLSLLETILAAASGEASLQMVSFSNQPAGVGDSVPDARISAKFSFWFEVKTERDALCRRQLREHLRNVAADTDSQRLFVLTPDPVQPERITELDDPRVVWFNFKALHDALDEAANDSAGFLSEQTRFLLQELRVMLVDDGLVDNDDVVIVAARSAYPEYLGHNAYICQPGRAFRKGLTHLGFYADGAIQQQIPRIRHRRYQVNFSPEQGRDLLRGSSTDRLFGEFIEVFLRDGLRPPGAVYQVFLLSRPEDPDTIHLARPIVNDTVTASGRAWAWTMGQRYTSLARLTKTGIGRTSELEH